MGTAYSLDLETLVTIPLFAAGLDVDDIEKPLGIAKIYALGQRLTLLVQGDRINMRTGLDRSRSLVQLVSNAVVPCSVRDGSFHPKLLVLKFREASASARPFYRVVVATRNLTVDNSWDSVMVLDQDPDGVFVPGLGDVVKGLAAFVNHREHAATKLCGRFGKELNGVRFQLPRGLAEVKVSLFTPGSPTADAVLNQLKGDDLLVISPFVRQEILSRLAGQAGSKSRFLVTRPVDVPKAAFDKYVVFQLTAGAVPDNRFAGTKGLGALRGLHAKLYLASSKGAGTRIVFTSANATSSGWRSNVEVAISAIAKGKAFEVPALLADYPSDDDGRSFRSLLEQFTFSAVIQEREDPLWQRKVRQALALAVAAGNVSKGPPRTLCVALQFPFDVAESLQGVSVEIHPLGYPTSIGAATVEGDRVTARLDIDYGIELVPFITIRLSRGDEGSFEVVLAMRLTGDLDWGTEDARKTLALAAKPGLVRELLWHCGVRGSGRNSSNEQSGAEPGEKKPVAELLPILEKVLLKVHGPKAKEEIDTIDGLLAGVTEDPEYRDLVAMWKLVRASLK